MAISFKLSRQTNQPTPTLFLILNGSKKTLICIIDSSGFIRVYFSMHLKVDVPVAVVFEYEPRGAKISPLRLRWDGRVYSVTKVGLHHQFRIGRTLHHIFSVVCGDTFFRLNLNTDNLSWHLEEISDGLPD